MCVAVFSHLPLQPDALGHAHQGLPHKKETPGLERAPLTPKSKEDVMCWLHVVVCYVCCSWVQTYTRQRQWMLQSQDLGKTLARSRRCFKSIPFSALLLSRTGTS